MRRLLLAVALAVSLVAVGGAGSAAAATQDEACSFPYTDTDATGEEVTLEERPERVTALEASAAQTMWALDAESQVVGVSQYALYLEGAESKTNISAAFGADVEKVIDTEPDLVLAPNVTSPETVDSLREAGLTVYQFDLATSIEDVQENTATIGRLTGNCEAAERTNEWVTRNVEAARQATSDVERPSVLYPLGGGYVAGSETFISAMIEASGGTNAAAEYSGYPQLDDEVILELQPEVLIVTESNSFVLGQEPYASTPAVENNRTVELEVNYLNQPAPRSLVYSVRNMTEQLHPDAYAEAEFVAKSEVTIETETETETETATETEVDDAGEETQSPQPAETGGQPGFGLVAALVAAGVAALAFRD